MLLLPPVQRVRPLDVGAVGHRPLQLVPGEPPLVDALLLLLFLEPFERPDLPFAGLPLGLGAQPQPSTGVGVLPVPVVLLRVFGVLHPHKPVVRHRRVLLLPPVFVRVGVVPGVVDEPPLQPQLPQQFGHLVLLRLSQLVPPVPVVLDQPQPALLRLALHPWPFLPLLRRLLGPVEGAVAQWLPLEIQLLPAAVLLPPLLLVRFKKPRLGVDDKVEGRQLWAPPFQRQRPEQD